MATPKPKNLGSYYRRPSAALERGGGFYVPGLQGYRLRLVIALVVILLLGLNRLPGYDVGASQLVSEATGVSAALFVGAQALLDQQTEKAVQRRRDALASAWDQAEGAAMEASEAYSVDGQLSEGLADGLRWAADIVLQLTPACTFVVFNEDRVLARIGLAGGESSGAQTLKDAVASAAGAGKDGMAFSRSEDGHTAQAALLRLLPDACQQGLMVPTAVLNSPAYLVLGTTLQGRQGFSAIDKQWVRQIGKYLATQ